MRALSWIVVFTSSAAFCHLCLLQPEFLAIQNKDSSWADITHADVICRQAGAEADACHSLITIVKFCASQTVLCVVRLVTVWILTLHFYCWLYLATGHYKSSTYLWAQDIQAGRTACWVLAPALFSRHLLKCCLQYPPCIEIHTLFITYHGAFRIMFQSTQPCNLTVPTIVSDFCHTQICIVGENVHYRL